MATFLEKTDTYVNAAESSHDENLTKADATENQEHEAHEVFKQDAGGVDFRTVSWPRATVIFLKIQFAMSILAVPGALATLGAVGGALSIVGWGALNTCECKLCRMNPIY